MRALSQACALGAIALFLGGIPKTVTAQSKVDENVVYGMYSGLALLMDVHYPEQPNGYGIVHVSGSGWSRPLAYSAPMLSRQPHVELEAGPLVAAGYTVFTVNHRATPRFQYPAPVQDVQRAVRYVRHHAADYGIDAQRIGAIGGSSGGHIVSMLGVLDGDGDPDDADPVNRESAKVQVVVARATPGDLLRMTTDAGGSAVALLLGAAIPRAAFTSSGQSAEIRRYIDASPVTYVSPDDPPFLFVHGDADDVVPFEQAELFASSLESAGVEVEIVRIPNAGHGPTFPGAVNPPDYVSAMVGWFDDRLKR